MAFSAENFPHARVVAFNDALYESAADATDLAAAIGKIGSVGPQVLGGVVIDGHLLVEPGKYALMLNVTQANGIAYVRHATASGIGPLTMPESERGLNAGFIRFGTDAQCMQLAVTAPGSHAPGSYNHPIPGRVRLGEFEPGRFAIQDDRPEGQPTNPMGTNRDRMLLDGLAMDRLYVGAYARNEESAAHVMSICGGESGLGLSGEHLETYMAAASMVVRDVFAAGK